MEYISIFENYLRENGKAEKTIESYTSDVRGFIGFLSLKGITIHLIESGKMTDSVINLGRDRIKIAKGSEKQVEIFTDDVVDALLFHLETKAKELRDKVVIQLLLYTGVRVSELVNIRIKDIDFLSHQLKVIGKGGKYREIPLKSEVVETIKKYLLERRHNPYYKSEYLLLGQRGKT